ncbi:MAG: hypothetical protein ACW967_04310, partial [Candidatus Hodarchaeales archaeon]
MNRFSFKAKEVFDAVWYHTDIQTAKTLSDELIEPLDIIFGNSCIIFYLICFYKIEEALELLNQTERENENGHDPLLDFLIDSSYCLYYAGSGGRLMVSREQTQHYFDLMEKIYPQIEVDDTWEQYFYEGWFYFVIAEYEHRMNDDLPKSLALAKRFKDTWRKIPQDGEYLSSMWCNIELGFFLRLLGDFKESETIFMDAQKAAKKYNNFWQYYVFLNLSMLNNQKGELYRAQEGNTQALEVAMQFDNTLGIYMN